MKYKKSNPFLPVYDIRNCEYITDEKNTIKYLGRIEKEIHEDQDNYENFDYEVTYTLNDLGYRCKYNTPPDTDYILVAGCSISYGHSIPQEYRYSDLLEKYYNMPVMNISVSGGSCNLIKDNILQLLVSGHRLPKLVIAQWPYDSRYWIGLSPYGEYHGDDNISGFIESSKHSFETTNYLCDKHNVDILNVKIDRAANDFDIDTLFDYPIYDDYGRDNTHPGIKTHYNFKKTIIKLLEQKNMRGDIQ